METNQFCPNCQKELEVVVKLQEYKEVKPVTVEERTKELKRVNTEKRKHLKQLLIEVQHARESLVELVEKKQALSVACSEVLTTKTNLQLTRLAYDHQKRSLKQELEELREVEKKNKRRDERLKHVRLKNFHKKEDEARADCLSARTQANQFIAELEVARRTFITDAYRCIFPIEVEALSERDAGEEDYLQMNQINCEESMEVDEGWVLSGVHTHPTPNMSIVTASIPSNGDYSAYIKTAAERRKLYSEAAQQGGGSSVMEVSATNSLHPSVDPYLRIPAALGYTAHLVVIISRVLDQPLPYPLQRHLAISEYNNPNQKKRVFLNSVARLDDDIMYLCFSQNVPLSALTPGHTLQNLLALVTHTHLGWSGAFECYPELTRYRGRSGKPLPSTLSHDPDDSEPPNVLYSADQSTHSYYGNKSDSDEDEEESDNTTEEETPTNYQADSNTFEWEHLDPSATELQLFQEEQLKLRSAATSLGSGTPSQADVELARDRARRLDYNSTYLDYVSETIRSLNESSSVQLSAKDSIRLLSSIDEEKRGVGPQAVTPTGDGDTPVATATTEGGLFGTLSSLWTSTFGGGGSSS